MNLLLWAIQIVLAVKFLSVAYSHGLRASQGKMRRGQRSLGSVGRPLLTAIALGALLGAAGLVLPGPMGLLPWLTPWAAVLLAVMMLAGLGMHLSCRDNASPVPGLVFLALAAFVAYGRWVLAPL